MMYVSISLINVVIVFPYLTLQQNIFENYGRDISSETINIHSKYLYTGDVRDLQRNGRPKKLTLRDEREIVRMITRNRTISI